MTVPYDLAWALPAVRQYLQAHGTPAIVSSSEILPALEAHPHRPRIVPRRMSICLAWSLQACGYRRRSRRGQVWDLEGGA